MKLNAMVPGLWSALLFASVALAKPFPLSNDTDQVESRPGNGGGCGYNGPNNRRCWKGQYTIDTDYEQLTPTTGRTRVVSHTPMQDRGRRLAWKRC